MSYNPPQPPSGAPDWNQQPPPDQGWGQPAPGPQAPGPGWGGDPGYGQQPQPGYGQQPPPGYGPPPGFGGPPPKKSSPLVPILLVVAVVAAVAVGAFFLLSGDDDSGPEAAARTYIDAAIAGDCDAMADMVVLHDQTPEQWLATCQSIFATGDDALDLPPEALEDLPAEVLSMSVDAETDTSATVTVEFRSRGDTTESEPVELTKVDGDWKVNIGEAVSPEDLDPPDDTTDDTTDDTSDDTTDDTSDDGVSSGDAGPASEPPLDNEEAENDSALVDLATACHDGDMAACDDLFWGTDIGGELENYGSTCGGRLEERNSGGCESLLG